MLRKLSLWSEVTTFHGIPEIRTSTIQKSVFRFLFWLLVVFLAVGMLVWQIEVLVTDYISGDGYSTSMYTQSVDSFTIPPIVLCNYNRADSTKVQQLKMSSSQLQYFFSGFLTDYIFTLSSDSFNDSRSAFESFKSQNSKNVSDSTSLLDMLAHSCEDTITACIYGQSGFQKSCCNDTFTVHNIYGSCIAVNKTSLTQTTPGPSNGLRILLNPLTERYQTELINNNYLDEGMIVIITENPHFTNPASPIHVMPGKHAFIELSQIKRTFTTPTYSVFKIPCIKNAKLKSLRSQYNKDSCKYDCTNYYVIKLCGCSLMGVDPLYNVTACDPESSICARLLTATNSTNATISQHQADMKSCQAECGATCDDTVEIKTSVSLSNFPSQKLSTEFSKTIGTLNSKMKNATSQNILLDIYYSSMSVLVIETSEKTSLFTIIASIGGHLGLWIGASLITAVQAIYYLLAACIEAIASKNKRKAPKIETILAS